MLIGWVHLDQSIPDSKFAFKNENESIGLASTDYHQDNYASSNAR